MAHLGRFGIFSSYQFEFSLVLGEVRQSLAFERKRSLSLKFVDWAICRVNSVENSLCGMEMSVELR